MAVILVGHDDAHAIVIRWSAGHILFPDNGQEQRSCGIHDGDVRQNPVTVVRLQGVDDTAEKGVMGNGGHDVVRDAGGVGLADPGGVLQ